MRTTDLAGRTKWLIGPAVLLLSTAFFWSFADYGLNSQDEGTILEQIARTAEGESPWLDFHVGYTPGIFLVHSLLMHWTGPDLIPGRLLLAIVNALSVALIWRLGVRVGLGSLAACLPALFYLAVLPVFPGYFCSFNIPYPAWYCVFLFLAGANVSVSVAERPTYVRILLLGLLAGLSFAFKPNVGAFQLAAAALVTLSVLPIGQLPGPRWRQRLTRTLWWGWWGAVVAGLFAVFAGAPTWREEVVFVAPAVVAALLVAWTAAVLPSHERPKSVLLSAIAMLGGFAFITVPWLWAVWRLIGLERLLQEVLMIGGSFERVYYIALPAIAVDSAIVLALLAAAWLVPPRLAKWKITPAYALLAAFFVGLSMIVHRAATHPPLEGFHAAVMPRVEPLVYAVTFAIHLLALWAWAREIWPEAERRRAVAGWSVLGVNGMMLYMSLYPRSDFMHWVTAAPVSLVSLTALLAMLAARWSSFGRPVARGLVMVPLAAPLLLIAGLELHRSLDTRLDFTWSGLRRTAEFQLRAEPGKVHVSAGASTTARRLDAVVEYLRRHTQPGEAVFPFPMLDLVSFLADRPSGQEQSYFFPGAPTHAEEVGILAELRRNPPRFAVIAYEHPMFFSAAPAYYFAIADFVDRNYRLAVRHGKFAILRRSDVVVDETERPLADSIEVSIPSGLREEIEQGLASPDVAERLEAVNTLEGLHLQDAYEPLVRALEDSDPRVRSAALRASAEMRDPATHAAILSGVVRGRFTRAESLLALLRAPMGCRATCIPPLMALEDGDDYEVSLTATNLLSGIGYNRMRASFWFGLPGRDPSTGDPSERVEDLDESVKRRLRARLLDDRKVGFDAHRFLALAYLDDLGIDPCSERIASLATDRSADVWGPSYERIAANLALARNGCAMDHAEDIVTRDLVFGDAVANRMILEVLRASGPAGDAALASVIREQMGGVRVTALWIAAVAGGPASRDAAFAFLHDINPETRMAASWAVAQGGDATAQAEIGELLTDGDSRVRKMAALALDASRSQPTAAAH